MSDRYKAFSTEPLGDREIQRVRSLLQDQRDRDAYARGGERLRTVSTYIGATLAVIAFVNMLAPGALARLFSGS